MARDFTVAQLILRGRQRCDQENRDILTAAEWQIELSTAFAEFYGIIVDAGARYWESTDSISALSGTADYALPADHLSTVGIDYTDGNITWDLAELMAQERNDYTGGGATDEARAYALIGANVRLYPTPSSSKTYSHIYVPQPTDISAVATSTTVDVITPDGESFLVWTLALIGGIKEESDQVPVYAQQMERARKRVVEWATNRSLYTPKKRIVADADRGQYGRDSGDWWPGG